MQLNNPKRLTLEDAVAERENLRAADRRLVLTNGCFDLLHPGHIHFLQESAKLGDALWVLINGDDSVRSLKGPGRPIQEQDYRAFAVAALECVDRVIIFEGERLNKEIEAIQPDIYTKAGDYSIDTIDRSEKAALEAGGTSIQFLPYLEGFSTSNLIERIAAANDL